MEFGNINVYKSNLKMPLRMCISICDWSILISAEKSNRHRLL